MKRIFSSMSSILLVGTITVLAGGVGAYLDENGATGETFATGVIDLKIDNESYMTNNEGKLVFSSTTSWKAKNLVGELFFDFDDVKPGDYGEDTISLHTNKEKAWSCMKVKLTEKNGELQDGLFFAFWADDGDNVFETDEKIFKKGKAGEIFDDSWWALADSKSNIWQKEGWNNSYKYEQKWNTNYSCKPIPEKSVRYVGKIWCFGEASESPLAQDGKGKIHLTGSTDSQQASSGQALGNGPLKRGTGWKCEGEDLLNEYQKDSIALDVSFLAMQAKVNSQFVCGENYHDITNNPKPKKFWFPFRFWN